MIKNRVEKYDDMLRKKADSLLKKSHDASLKEFGYQVYCSDSRTGWCSFDNRTITVPLWAIEKSENKNYWVYYLAHELAHAATEYFFSDSISHGPEFMQQFKLICPAYLQKFEYNYKPRNAKAAGVKR